ncbi:hypothetical protein J2S74_001460 [Evansella vedderi]|uniref:Uncharacterized protein n=1 Tax=Evansella vedderi TaxID=38282 RepID=A0ABT9ZS92_9BACI|nr:hypothetical protein [Evansella vedderi]MDQ0254087.1 hypothetical protein [Evansella vedderi]
MAWTVLHSIQYKKESLTWETGQGAGGFKDQPLLYGLDDVPFGNMTTF